MNEMAVTADHLIVIGQGKLLRDEGVNEFVESNSVHWVLVRSPQLDELSAELIEAGAQVKPGSRTASRLPAWTLGPSVTWRQPRASRCTSWRPSGPHSKMRSST